MSEVISLEEVKNGLLSTAMYASERLQWLTDEGWRLYNIRSKSSDFYAKETETITKACCDIKDKLSNNITIVDLGAGDVNAKSIAMLENILQENASRTVCYIPIDISENVKHWKSIDDHVPSVADQVAEVVPLVGDMVDILSKIQKYIPEMYRTWQIMCCNFGPNPMCLPNQLYLDCFEKISDLIKQNGGWYFVTYLPLTENTADMVTEHIFHKMDMQGMLKSVLLGLNKVAEADLDLAAFEYKTKFSEKFVTEGVDGFWSGCVYYAQAVRDVTCKSDKFNIERVLKKDEIIRLSEDVVKSHYYEEQYFKSLGSNKKLPIVGSWTESSGLLSCMVYRV